MGRKKQKPNKKLEEHLLEYVKTMKPRDFIELIALGGICYYGYQATQDIRGPIIGAVGYKLATTEGGTPPVSQIAGLSILGAMGLTLLGKFAPYSINIGGFEIPQMLPDPITYLTERINAINEGRPPPKYGWYTNI